MIVLFGVLSMALQVPTGEAAPTTAQPGKEKKVCRAGPQAPNSRLTAPKVCRTPSEWAKIEAGGTREADMAREVQQLR